MHDADRLPAVAAACLIAWAVVVVRLVVLAFWYVVEYWILGK